MVDLYDLTVLAAVLAIVEIVGLSRLRYSPFYDFLENRVLEWLDG
jgi:hypothetical protein